MAFKALFLVALIAAAVAAASATVAVPFGGASSVVDYEQDVINMGPGTIAADVGNYTSVDSTYGLTAFCNGSLAIAASYYPEGGCNTPTCTMRAFETLPQVLGAVSVGMYGTTNGSIALTAQQIFLIYNGTYTTSAHIPGSGLGNTTITRVVRCDTSGTTSVFTSWLKAFGTAIPYSQVGIGPWNPTGNHTCGIGGSAPDSLIYVCKSKVGSICYATSSDIAGSGINEVYVQNAVRKPYIRGSNAVLRNSLPASGLPTSCNAS